MLEGRDVQLLGRCDAVTDDRLRQAAPDTGKKRGSSRIARRQVCLNAESRHPAESPTFENCSEPRADPRPRPNGTKGLLHPPQNVVHERYGRLGARSAEIEVNRDEFATGTKVVQVMAHDGGRVRNVKEQEPTDDSVKRLGRAPRPRVAFYVREMAGSSFLRSFTGDRDRIGGPIDSQNGA